ncbi:MAG: amino acid adenylation domain-containing protein, partial [Crocinitomix sp.]
MKEVYSLLKELRQLGARIYVENDQLNLDIKKGLLTPELGAKIKRNKTAILDFIKNGANGSNSVEIPLLNEATIQDASKNGFAISDAQNRLWVLCQFDEASTVYNISSSVYLNQNFDINCFKKAITATLNRHEILRTVFRENEQSEVRQWILESEDLGFEITYENYVTSDDSKQMAQAYIDEDVQNAFDLENGPLMRTALLQVDEQGYIFYFNMHHLISDAWSMQVLSKDLFTYYEAFKANKEPQLNDLRIQYKEYSAWQLSLLNNENYKAHGNYWLERLSGELPILDLPSAKQRPKIKTNNGLALFTYLDKELTAKLQAHAQLNGGSVFMELLAAWNVLMYKYTGQTDLIMGTTLAGREHVDLNDQIGFYVNALALRNEINPAESYNTFYNRLKENTLNDYQHQTYPFDRLIEKLELQRNTSRSAIFDLLISLENSEGKQEGFQLTKEEENQITDLGVNLSKFDLEIIFSNVNDWISLKLGFNSDVYDTEMIESLIRHFKQLLSDLLENPDKKIAEVNYLSTLEKQEQLITFNQTTSNLSNDGTLLDLFKTQVEKQPNAIAVNSLENTFTYEELDAITNQLAHCLSNNYDVKPTDLVGIKLDKDEWAVIAMLGVLKAGAAYIPIDPAYPAERRAHILNESKIELLIINTNYLFDEVDFEGTVFAVDVEFEKEEHSSAAINNTADANSLAYVIYTSGSTGQPKGVMIEHGSLGNYLKWGLTAYAADGNPLNFGLFTSLSFDLTITSLYLPLVSGGTLSIFENLTDVSSVIKTYFESDLNSIKLTPAHISLVGELQLENTKIQKIIVGGDALKQSQIRILRRLNSSIQIFNEYGPTEATVGCILKEIRAEQQSVLIGKPIANTQIYLLDDACGLLPKGVVGEICIAGSGLARGYLNRENLTQEKFINNPFVTGSSLYKTGDLGRWTENGEIEFLGRKDEQVKIRGYRIELGEIENVLGKHEGVDNAALLVKEDEQGEKNLVAYVVPNNSTVFFNVYAIKDKELFEGEINEDFGITNWYGKKALTHSIKASLLAKLPDYMVPSNIAFLENMPLTSNGKIDRKALLDIEWEQLGSKTEFIAPRTIIEEKLVEIWEAVLQRENIGVQDDFFVLGGHSLKAVRLSNEYQKTFNVKLTINELFANTALESHGKLIEGASKTELRHIAQQATQESYPISDAQRRLWVLSQFDQGSAAYNIPERIHLNQDVKIEEFKKAINATIERHEILRTVFKDNGEGEIYQWVIENSAFNFEIFNADYSQNENPNQSVQDYVNGDKYTAFDLENGPLIRAALLQIGKAEYVFYFNMH